MVKISKSDLVLPRAEEDAQRAAQAAKPRPKSQHFAVGTWVVRKNVRGLITAMSKDGGTKIVVEWEDGTKEIIPNPGSFINWRKRQ